jgi:hypothetical protein
MYFYSRKLGLEGPNASPKGLCHGFGVEMVQLRV